MRRRAPLVLALSAALALGATSADAAGDRCRAPALHIHKGRGELILTCAGKVTLRAPVTFGGTPRGPKRRSGDHRTPEGRYFICNKHPSRKFHRFLGVSYPNAADARIARRQGLITAAQHDRILAAQKKRRCPPWGTRLGGAIGIHGVKPRHDLLARIWTRVSRIGKLYQHLGLTAGCIAVTNDAIDRLWRLVPVGTPLYIHPVATRSIGASRP